MLTLKYTKFWKLFSWDDLTNLIRVAFGEGISSWDLSVFPDCLLISGPLDGPRNTHILFGNQKNLHLFGFEMTSKMVQA